MIYCFHCASPEHPADVSRDFEQIIHHVPKKGQISQYSCECGAVAKRDLSREIPTQNTIGLTPINVSDSKNSIGNEVSFAFGKFKKNPDGSEDRNHAAFRDTGELNAYMNGRNELGEPVMKDNGQPLRRADGSIVRRGAKMVKFNKNKTPSTSGPGHKIHGIRDAWTDEGTMNRSGAKPSAWKP